MKKWPLRAASTGTLANKRQADRSALSNTGLNLRSKKPRRHVLAARRVEWPLASRPNEIWAMDFVSDVLFNWKCVRALTVFDAYTRKCLAIQC